MKRVASYLVLALLVLSFLPVLQGPVVHAQDLGGSSPEGGLLETIQAINPPLTAVLLTITVLLWRAYREEASDYRAFLKEEISRQRQFTAASSVAVQSVGGIRPIPSRPAD